MYILDRVLGTRHSQLVLRSPQLRNRKASAAEVGFEECDKQ
jgi:hypothetical protein